MSKPVAFIVGYGKEVGASVARKFRSEGFRIAAAARSITPGETPEYDLGVKLDLSNTADIGKAFETVESALGPASVVVYNAAAASVAPGGATDPLSLSVDAFNSEVAITGVNAYDVAKRANVWFDKLGTGARAFIATGNILPWIVLPHLLGLSAGKRVLASIVESSAHAYGPVGKRFYFASQVSPTGGPSYSTHGESHAIVYWRLYQQAEQGDWDVRFTLGGEPWRVRN